MNIETVRNTIALCRSFKSCRCFDRIFTLQPFYNADNETEYICLNTKSLQSYSTELLKHINKDVLYNQLHYQTIDAETLKKAFDHHIQTLHLFERYILKNTSNDFIIYNDGNGDCDVSYYVDTILKLITSYEKTNRLFNQPLTPIPTRRILDEIDFHLYTLRLFENYILFQTVSKSQKKSRHGQFFFSRQPNLCDTQTGWTYIKNFK